MWTGRRRKVSTFGALLAALSLLTSAARAGDRAPTSTSKEEGTSATSGSGPGAEAPRPSHDPVFDAAGDDASVPSFLRALRAGKDSLLLGGWIRPGFVYVSDSEWNDDDADGFEFLDARIVGRGDASLNPDFGAKFRFNFDVNRGNFAVRDTYGSLEFRNGLAALDIGLLKTPLGLSLLQTQAKLQLPVNTSVRRLSFGRDLGAQLRSEFEVGRAWFQVSAMASNGEGGFRQRRNLDDSFVLVGRLEAAPLGQMERSEADLNDSRFQVALGVSAGHNFALTNDLGLHDVGAEETKLEVDARAWFRGASARFEYLRGLRSANAASPAFSRYGFVAQAGYVLPIPLVFPRFEVVGRLQQADVNTSRRGDEGEDFVVDEVATRIVEVGGNVYLARHAAKLQVSYQRTDFLEATVPTRELVPMGDAVVFALQFAWL